MAGRVWLYYAGFVMLLAMLVGGGTVQGLWTDRVIQIALIPAIMMGLGRLDDSRWTIAAKALALMTILIFVIQFLPVGRTWPSVENPLASGTFLTATAGRTLESMLFFVPLLGFALFVSRLDSVTQEELIRFFIIGLFLNLIIGGLQLSLADRASGADGSLLPYALSAGVFANENHFSSLVYSTIPLCGYLLLSRQDRPGIFLALTGIILVYLFAIGSRASVLIAICMTGVTLTLYWQRLRSLRFGWPAMALFAVVLAGTLYLRPDLLAIEDRVRSEILGTTLRAAMDYLPFGTGSGSFESVYAMYEDKALIRDFYINHAHNDFIEVFLETGILGILLIGWFVILVATSPSSPFRWACKLSILALAIHSTVDYPLRTFAIGILMAFLAGCVLQKREKSPSRSHSKTSSHRPVPRPT